MSLVESAAENLHKRSQLIVFLGEGYPRMFMKRNDEDAEKEQSMIQAILDYMRHANRLGLDKIDFQQFMDFQRHQGIRGDLIPLIDDLAYNEGIDHDENYGLRDLRPDLDHTSKRMLILMALENFQEKRESTRFFQSYLRRMKVGEELLEVEKVCERYYDFILYKILGQDGFVTTELLPHSSTWATTEFKLSRMDAISYIISTRWHAPLTWDSHSKWGPADFGIQAE